MKYNIGDKAWHAVLTSVTKSITCPDCFGKKFLTVILGDDSQVTVACTGCDRNEFHVSEGLIRYYAYEPFVRIIEITKVEVTSEGVEYGFDRCYGTRENNLFSTEEAAQARAVVLAKEYTETELKRRLAKTNDKKSWAWHATYHRRGIKEAQKQLEYHTSNLEVAKSHAKE